MLRRCFRAMGTAMELILRAPPSPAAFGAMSAAELELRRLERLLSRFDGDSELSQLNREGTLVASRDMRAVVELALAARERTCGRFDPTVHDALVAAGYDRSFDELPAHGVEAMAEPAPCAGRVDVDPTTARIRLATGVHLDLGGIAKGYAAERAAAILARAGDALVDAGGDIAVRGGPWPIGVETGDGKLTLELARGAVATSGRDRRRWRRGAEEQHHIIDPRTDRPSTSDLLRVTVVADDAVEAEVLAKALFLCGADAAQLEADEAGIPAILITGEGRTRLVGGLA